MTNQQFRNALEANTSLKVLSVQRARHKEEKPEKLKRHFLVKALQPTPTGQKQAIELLFHHSKTGLATLKHGRPAGQKDWDDLTDLNIEIVLEGNSSKGEFDYET